MHNEEDFSLLQDGTNLRSNHIFPYTHNFHTENYIYAYLCIQSFPKQFTDDYLSNHLYGQEARNVFVQHPRYNIEVFLKWANIGQAIINSRWAKVAHAFNIIVGSILHSASTASQTRFICLSIDYETVLCKGCYTTDLMLLYCGLLYYLLVVL